jgi:glycosyltransferase involved in cell wall biosynthesis
MTLHEPLRVLSLIPTFWPRQGGAQMVLASIARALAPRVETTVLTRGYAGCPDRQRYDHLDVHRYRSPAPDRWKDYATGTHHVSFPAKAYVGLCDAVGSLPLLARLAPHADVLHLHFPLPLGLSVLALPRRLRRPLVVTVHGNADIYELPPAFAPLTRAVLKRADATVSVSSDLAGHLSNRLGVRAVTVANAVDTALFRPEPRAPTEKVTLVSISRIVPRKNIHVLIEAVQALARMGERRLELVVAGAGPSQARVAEMAARSPVTRFVGFVDEARKRELIAGADAFVQLSVREGLSIATLEALACGVPCVVSDLPGVREPILPGETGYLVPDPENVDSVMGVLRRVLRERDQLGQMRAAARRLAEERYSLGVMAEGYYRIYRQVVEEAPACDSS